MTKFRPAHLTMAFVALLSSTLAQAQSNVTITGSLDAGIFRDTASRWNLGTIQRSHLQFAGTEDLGGGYAATFRLRHRLDLDTGASEGAGSRPFWHGESTIGLRGPFGSIRLGRALDAIQSHDWAFDPWGNYDRIASPAWDLWHWNYSSDPVAGGSGRVGNAVFYDSPKFADMTVHVSVAPESAPGAKTKTRAASLQFNNGSVRALLGIAKNQDGGQETFMAVRGTIADLTLMGVYNPTQNAAGVKAKTTTLGAMYALGATTLKAGWGRVEVNNATPERLTSIGASHALSKRTTVYADLASKRFPNPTGDKTVYGIGLTHSF